MYVVGFPLRKERDEERERKGGRGGGRAGTIKGVCIPMVYMFAQA